MSICYLCGEEMLERAFYDANKEKFAIAPKLKHDEHIIQDALYGRLTANDILCEKCGSDLSVEIDSDFVKIFQTLTEQVASILASKTKNSNFVRSLHGHVILKNGHKVDVFIKEGKISPARPFYDPPNKGIVNVYGEEKTAKQYINKAKSDLDKAGYNLSELEFRIVEDLQDYTQLGINFTEGITDFNKKFKMGFVKIAPGFAVKNGVDRSHLTNTLDTANNKMIYTEAVVPFVPWGVYDLIADPLRIALEPEYPTHTLILYVEEFDKVRRLVCYIDLLSTFAYYVVLNYDYKGPTVHATYYQGITRKEKPDINVRATRPKHLNILMDGLNVSPGEVKGMNLDETYDYLEKKYLQWNVSYQLDLGETIKAMSSRMMLNIVAQKSGNAHLLTGIEKELSDAIPDLGAEDLLTLQQEFTRIEDENPEDFYRQNYVEFEMVAGARLHSTLGTLIDLQHTKPEVFARYTHAKFYQFDYFIKNNKTP